MSIQGLKSMLMTFCALRRTAAFRTAKLHDAAILDHDQTPRLPLHTIRELSIRKGRDRRAFSETESEPGWSGGIVIPELAL
jgi:hypothetical protein